MARRAKKTKTTKKGRFSSFTVFVMGLIVGAASTALYIGVVRDQPLNVGAGINKILEGRQAATTQGAGDPAGSEDEITGVRSVDFSYDFYEILIEDRDKSASQEKQPAAKTAATSSPSAGSTGTAQPAAGGASATAANQEKSGTAYVLQVGSYLAYDDADSLKATLALNGILSFIQKATINDREYYRVRTGPYDNVQNMNRVSQALSNLGHAPLRYKLSPRG